MYDKPSITASLLLSAVAETEPLALKLSNEKIPLFQPDVPVVVNLVPSTITSTASVKVGVTVLAMVPTTVPS